MKKARSIEFWIKYFLEMLPEFTHDEANFIEACLHWEDEKRAGFLFAKRLFEGEDPHEE